MSLIQEGLSRTGSIGHDAVDLAQRAMFGVVSEEGPISKAIDAYASLLGRAREEMLIITPRLNEKFYADPRIVNVLRQALTKGVQVSILTGAEGEEKAMEALRGLPEGLTLYQHQKPHLEDSNDLPLFLIAVDGRHVCIGRARRESSWIEGGIDFPPTVSQNDNCEAAGRIEEKFARLASTAQEIPLH